MEAIMPKAVGPGDEQGYRQFYGQYVIHVFQMPSGMWCAEWWKPSKPACGGALYRDTRAWALIHAKQDIDAVETVDNG